MNAKYKILLAQPRGFCAGVERAIEIVEKALEIHGAPVYVRHEIVHNKRVVETLRKKGAVFVNEIEEIPDKGMTIFSAHGIAEVIENTGAINVDFNDVNTVMKNSGVAIMGSAVEEGDNRAIKAVQAALESPLLNDNDISGAEYVLLNITYGDQ